MVGSSLPKKPRIVLFLIFAPVIEDATAKQAMIFALLMTQAEVTPLKCGTRLWGGLSCKEIVR